MNYAATWKLAKKEAEEKTGQKKPSEKFLGVFRASSGIEAACKGLDDSLKKPKAAQTKALDAYKAASKKYIAVLTKAEAKGDPGADHMLKALSGALAEITREFEKDYMKDMPNPFYEGPKPGPKH